MLVTSRWQILEVSTHVGREMTRPRNTDTLEPPPSKLMTWVAATEGNKNTSANSNKSKPALISWGVLMHVSGMNGAGWGGGVEGGRPHLLTIYLHNDNGAISAHSQPSSWCLLSDKATGGIQVRRVAYPRHVVAHNPANACLQCSGGLRQSCYRGA